jgi:hypothetical protein
MVCFSGMISSSRIPDKRSRDEYSPYALKNDTICGAALAQSLKGPILVPFGYNPFTGECFLTQEAGFDGSAAEVQSTPAISTRSNRASTSRITSLYTGPTRPMRLMISCHSLGSRNCSPFAVVLTCKTVQPLSSLSVRCPPPEELSLSRSL